MPRSQWRRRVLQAPNPWRAPRQARWWSASTATVRRPLASTTSTVVQPKSARRPAPSRLSSSSVAWLKPPRRPVDELLRLPRAVHSLLRLDPLPPVHGWVRRGRHVPSSVHPEQSINARDLECSPTVGWNVRGHEPTSLAACGDGDVEEDLDAARVDEAQLAAVENHVTVAGRDVLLETATELLGGCHVELAGH